MDQGFLVRGHQLRLSAAKRPCLTAATGVSLSREIDPETDDCPSTRDRRLRCRHTILGQAALTRYDDPELPGVQAFGRAAARAC